MLVKLTSKRQVTFPARVLEELGVSPGDQIELVATEEGYLLRPRQVFAERLAPLKDKLRRGLGTFDLERFRQEARDASLRD